MQAGVQLGQDDRRQQDPDSVIRWSRTVSVPAECQISDDCVQSHCGFHSVCRNKATLTVVRLRPEGAKEELVTQELPWRSFFVIPPVPCVCTFTLGQLLALYEHRTAVQSGCLGVNSKSSASLCLKNEVPVSSVFNMDEMTDVIGCTSDHGSKGVVTR